MKPSCRIRIVTANGGEAEIDAEEIRGGWALHRAHQPDSDNPDLWGVTWCPSGHGLGNGDGRAVALDRATADRLFAMVTERWPYWPRRFRDQRLTAALKRRTTAALRDDVLAILEGLDR